MLTLKLCKEHVTKIVEALEIDIFPCGKAAGSDEHPEKRTNKVREIAVRNYEGKHEAYYVGQLEDVEQSNPALSALRYDVAYIENGHGATTETVRAY